MIKTGKVYKNTFICEKVCYNHSKAIERKADQKAANMKKTQWKDSIRNIRKEKVSFISIAIIALLAVASYLGINFTSEAMRQNADNFYRKTHVRDFEISSTMLLGEEDLQSLPEVKVILSGMSDEEQLRANVETFRENKPLNEEEMGALMAIAKEMSDERLVPCTACHYCTDHCPIGLDIPRLIELYNEHTLTVRGGLFGFIAPMAMAAIPPEKQPSACLDCGSCEKVCPQQIQISDVMEDFVKQLS